MYKTKGDYRLLNIYNNCQDALNFVLSNDEFVKKLTNIKLTNNDGKPKLAGYLREDVRAIIGNPLLNKVPDSWYTRILYHNIIQLLKSRNEQIQIYNLLKLNNFKIDNCLRSNLTKHNLFPTNAYLKTLSKSRNMPTLPKSKKFILDFSISAPQMFKISENQLGYSIKIYSYKEAKKRNISQWVNFNIYIPAYVRESFNGQIAKPQFYWDNELNDFVCAIPCQIDIRKNNFKNILGIDLGKVKVYSGSVLYENGTLSKEYTPSKELQNLVNKLNKINNHINLVYSKKERSSKYGNETLKQARRDMDYLNNRNKKKRLQKAISRLLASEVVQIALREECKEIHVENLSWLLSIGRKWNHSMIQKHLEEVAELYGIKVIKVSCRNTSKRNPITKEIGKSSGRKIIFKKSKKIDRDRLASINIALERSKIKLKNRRISQEFIRTRRSSRRSFYKMFKSINQIAMYSHNKVNNEFAIVSLSEDINYDLIKSNVYFDKYLQKLTHI